MRKLNETTLEEKLHDPLFTFRIFECILASFLVSIPLILYAVDFDAEHVRHHGFRSSISNYVYMYNSQIFGLLLGTAAMLFIFNGVIYLRNEGSQKVKADTSGKWYNLVLGICLLGVAIFPHLEFPVIHYIFAGLFFAGNAVTTIIFHTKHGPNRIKPLAYLRWQDCCFTLPMPTTCIGYRATPYFGRSGYPLP